MWRISVLLLICLSTVPAYSKDPPQTPRVETEEQTKDSPPSNDNPRQNPQAVTVPPPISLQQASNIDAKKTSEDAQGGSDEASEYWTLASHRVKVTDTLLVGFTALLFGATLFLYFATRSLVTGAEANAEHELRAYMGVERIRIQEESFGAGPPGQWSIKIRNFGKTMAKDTEVWIGGALVSVGNFDFPSGERRSKTVVMPQEAMGFEEIMERKRSDIDLFDVGSGSIYVWGKITYKDVFDMPRWTIFRFKTYEEGTRTEGGLRTWKVRTDGEGANDAN
jgi:hypothetical protein